MDAHYLFERQTYNILWACFHPETKKSKQKSVFIIFCSIKLAPIDYYKKLKPFFDFLKITLKIKKSNT
jgi:hypothetical protein